MSDETQIDILIVDDDTEFSSIVREVAEECNLKSEVISDPNQFKKKFEELTPRIVVMDIAMPDIDGVQLSQWLGKFVRANDLTCKLIIISGYGTDFIRMCSSIAALSGLEDVQGFSKPMELATLAQALTEKNK